MNVESNSEIDDDVESDDDDQAIERLKRDLDKNPHDDGTSTDIMLAIQKYLDREELPNDNAFFKAADDWTKKMRDPQCKCKDSKEKFKNKRCPTHKLLALKIPSVILERREGKESIKFLQIGEHGLELRDMPEAEAETLTIVKLDRDDKAIDTVDGEVCDEHIVKVLVDGKPRQWELLYFCPRAKGVKKFERDVSQISDAFEALFQVVVNGNILEIANQLRDVLRNVFSPNFNGKYYAHAIAASTKNNYQKSKYSVKEITNEEKKARRKDRQKMSREYEKELRKPLGRSDIVGSQIHRVKVEKSTSGKKTPRFNAKEKLTNVLVYYNVECYVGDIIVTTKGTKFGYKYKEGYIGKILSEKQVFKKGTHKLKYKVKFFAQNKNGEAKKFKKGKTILKTYTYIIGASHFKKYSNQNIWEELNGTEQN